MYRQTHLIRLYFNVKIYGITLQKLFCIARETVLLRQINRQRKMRLKKLVTQLLMTIESRDIIVHVP